MKKMLIFTVVVLMILLTACAQQTKGNPIAEPMDESMDNDISEILSDKQIIKVDANDFDVTEEVDLDWLKSQLGISESATIPSEVMALELDVVLYFDDETHALIRYLSDREDIISLRYNEISYTLKSAEIAYWLDTLT